MKMEKKDPLYRSFGYAFQGIFTCVRKERNMKIHCVAAVLVVIAGVILKISLIISSMPASFPFSKCVPKLHNSKRDRLNFNWGRGFFPKTPSPIEIVLIVLFIFPRPPYLCLEQICLCLNMEVSTLQFCKASYDCKSQTGAL